MGKISWRRGRNFLLAGGLAVVLAAGYGNDALATSATWLTVAHTASLGAGQTGPRSAVPWRQVGPGWVLAEYWPGSFGFVGKPMAAAAVLYLFDPAGGRYRLYRWPVTENPPFLEDWSGDKTRALLSTAAGALEQVILATGKVSHIRLPGQTQAIGYTRPSGQGLLGWRLVGSHYQLARYHLNGRLAKVLMSGALGISAVYSGTGATLAVQAPHGLWLLSNHGGLLRALPVPGAGAGCYPSRWWNSGAILARCQSTSSSRSRLWLVPGDGSSPMPLTAQRTRHSPDPGDLGAWRSSRRLYLQALSYYGFWRIFRQAANGQVAGVTVPRTAGDNWILTARGPRLLLLSPGSPPCSQSPSTSLLWFNPVSRHEQILMKAPRGLVGVYGAVPYGQPTAPFIFHVACAG